MAGAGVGAVGLGLAPLIGPGASVVAGRSRARPVVTEHRPPVAADVVIVGGGNIGAAAAFFLAKLGMSVVVCEKGAVGAEASSRSVGHVFSLGLEKDKIELSVLAKRMWPELNSILGRECSFRQTGLMMQIAGEEDLHYWQEWLEVAKELSPQARLLKPEEIAALVRTKSPWYSAVYDPQDGAAEPPLVAPAFADAARELGARLVAPCAVRGIETTAGAVSSVVTEFGPIKTRHVILAGGAWSTAFVENLDLRLPIGNLFSWCASFASKGGPATNAIFEDTTWRRQIDGGFTTSLMEASAPITPQTLHYLREMMGAMEVANAGWTVRPRLGPYFFDELFTPMHWKLDEVSPFEKRRILEPAINQRVINKAITKMRAQVPEFSNLAIKDIWGGVLSSTTDTNPVISPVAAIPGLIVASGFSDGLSLAPAVGKVLADMVSGKAAEIELKPFRFERFN